MKCGAETFLINSQIFLKIRTVFLSTNCNLNYEITGHFLTMQNFPLQVVLKTSRQVYKKFCLPVRFLWCRSSLCGPCICKPYSPLHTLTDRTQHGVKFEGKIPCCKQPERRFSLCGTCRARAQPKSRQVVRTKEKPAGEITVAEKGSDLIV